jgi:hypothetical protein
VSEREKVKKEKKKERNGKKGNAQYKGKVYCALMPMLRGFHGKY